MRAIMSTEDTPRASQRNERTVLSLPPEIRARLVGASELHRRTLSGEATIALERHLDEPRLSDGEPKAAA
jgi:hypothetical protein